MLANGMTPSQVMQPLQTGLKALYCRTRNSQEEQRQQFGQTINPNVLHA
jgi:hypothetical protein